MSFPVVRLSIILLLCVRVLAVEVPKWGMFEAAMTNDTAYSNKFRDVLLAATFTSPSGRTVPFWGFFDGDGSGGPAHLDVKNWVPDTGGEISGTVWKLRFMPDEVGTWTYSWQFDDHSQSGTGTFECVATGAKPGVLNVDRRFNNRWVANDEGPFLVKPMYDWAGNNLAVPIADYRNGYDAFLDKGYNFICFPWLPLWDWNTGQIDPTANGGKVDPFIQVWYQHGDYSGAGGVYDTDRMNLFTWRRLDEHIGYLADRGAYTFGFQGFNIKRTWPIKPHTFSREKYDWYVRYTTARLAPYYNVIWQNTWESDNGAQWLWDDLGNKQFDPWRRLWLHVERSTADCVDDDIQYAAIPTTSDRLHWCLEDNDGPGLWGPAGQGSAPGCAAYDDQRLVMRIALKFFLRASMALPIEYGQTGQHADVEKKQNWHYNGTTDGVAYMAHMWQAIDDLGVEFWDMASHDNLLTNDGGKGFCLADPDDEYLVFREGGGSFTISLVAGSYILKRANPYTGVIQASATINADGSAQTFTTTGDDRLLHFKKQGVIIGNPPVITAVGANPDPVVGATTALQVSASDPDNDPLGYSWAVLAKPAGATPLIGTGEDPTVTFDQAGAYVFAVTVSDGKGGSDSAEVPVTVEQTAVHVVISP